MIYVLDQTERDVFLGCSDVISFNKLQELFPHIADHELAAMLHTFEEKGIVYREDDFYLGLPLNYRLLMGISPEKPQKQVISNLC